MLKKIMIITVALLLSLLTVVGCSGDKYGKVKIEGKQDVSYTVYSQGGSAVQYGNYVYFLNGTRGYADEEGKSNVFGEVQKGAVYRAELLGEKGENGEFIVKRDSVTKLNFASTVQKDYKNDDEDVVDVQLIAPKTVGTSGYNKGGIYIFDNSLYYASPTNTKDKTGAVQYSKTDFFVMTLDGKTTKKVYTTKNDSTTSDYNFYSVGNRVYLVVLDGTDLISVEINKKNGKVEDTLKIAQDVTDVAMGVKPLYYKGISENTIYDFIVFERAATKDDTIASGEVLEVIRPNGDGRRKFAADGKSDYVLEGMRDGYLYYRQPKNYGTESALYATNLHGALVSDEKYAEDAINADTVNIDKQVLAVSGLNELIVYAYAPGYEFGKFSDNEVTVITTTKATQTESGEASTVTSTLYVEGALKGSLDTGASITIGATVGKTGYYFVGDILKKFIYGNGIYIETITTGANVSTFTADLIAGHLVYFGKINDDAKDYTFFYELDGLDGVESKKFVGKLTEADKLSTTEELKVVAQPTKTNYNVGDKIELSGLIVEAVSYADSEGNRPENKEITVTEDMLSGFDSSSAGDKTVTITYDKKTVTFTVKVTDPNAATAAA